MNCFLFFFIIPCKELHETKKYWNSISSLVCPSVHSYKQSHTSILILAKFAKDFFQQCLIHISKSVPWKCKLGRKLYCERSQFTISCTFVMQYISKVYITCSNVSYEYEYQRWSIIITRLMSFWKWYDLYWTLHCNQSHIYISC